MNTIHTRKKYVAALRVVDSTTEEARSAESNTWTQKWEPKFSGLNPNTTYNYILRAKAGGEQFKTGSFKTP